MIKCLFTENILNQPNGQPENIDVKIPGFYSCRHKSVFAHHTNSMSMHLIIKDKIPAGHADGFIRLRLFLC